MLQWRISVGVGQCAPTIWIRVGFPRQSRHALESGGHVSYAPQLEVGLDLGEGLGPGKYRGEGGGAGKRDGFFSWEAVDNTASVLYYQARAGPLSVPADWDHCSSAEGSDASNGWTRTGRGRAVQSDDAARSTRAEVAGVGDVKWSQCSGPGSGPDHLPHAQHLREWAAASSLASPLVLLGAGAVTVEELVVGAVVSCPGGGAHWVEPDNPMTW